MSYHSKSMKKIFILCLLLAASLGLSAQGKFFGGNSLGYGCDDTGGTLSCQPTSGQAILNGCDRLTVNGQTFETSGTYVQNLTNVFGCDSMLTLVLTIQQVDSTVSVLGQTMTAIGAGTYQWLYCDSSWMPIPGATQQSFTPTQSGSYGVAVTLNGCSDTSGCDFIFVVGTDPELAHHGYAIRPQPAVGFIGLEVPADHVVRSLALYDVLGRKVEVWAPQLGPRMRLPMPATRGLYFLHIVEEEGRAVVLRVLSE
jgi:hypothetical protein